MTTERRMRRTVSMILALVLCMVMTAAVFTEDSFAAGRPGRIKKSAIKVTNIKTNSAVVKYGKSSGAKKYQVAYKSSGAKWKYKTTSNHKVTLKNLRAGTKYSLKIRGIRTSKIRGNWSSAISFRTAAGPSVIKKSTIKIKDITESTAVVQYGRSIGAKKYEVLYRCEGGDWTYKISNKRSLKLKNLQSGTKFRIKVRGVNGSKKGNWSEAVSFTTSPASPGGDGGNDDANAPEATDVQYIEKYGRKTGIKSFTIEPYTYYNLSQDSEINPGGDAAIVLDDTRLRDVTAHQIFPKWSVIAEGIFRNQASQLVTIQGSGMMSSGKTPENSFDRQFSYTNKGVTKMYGYDWTVSDLAAELARETSDQKGKTNWDERRSTGIVAISNLAGARRLMGQELRNCADDDDISVDEFLGNSYDKSDNKYRLPDLQNEDTGGGFASVVTCVNRAGVSGDYDYVSFGIAVYDFDISPVAAKDLQYIEAAADVKDGQDILMGLKGDDVEETGVRFSSKDRKAVVSYVQNKSPLEDSFQTALKNNTTEQNTITSQDTKQWGMSQSVGLNINVDPVSGGSGGVFPRATITTNFTWSELWSSMQGKSNSKTVGDEKSINNTLTLPGYTVAKVTQYVNDKSTTENYQQPYILNYKIAVFAMSGDYYNGGTGGISSSRYDKQWMSILFDGSDGSSTSGCCALSSLYNRAVTNQNTQGYDGAYGKYRSWCDKGAWNSSSKIEWKKVASELTDANETRDSHNIKSSRTGKKSTLQDMATELPFLERAQMLESAQVNMSSSVDQIVALYPLSSVVISKDAGECTAKPNETFHLGGIELRGLNEKNADFYGFRDSWGEWKLYDKDKGVIEDGSKDDQNSSNGEITAGKFTLINDETLGTQSVKVDHTAADGDRIYLKWMLDLSDATKIISNENLISGDIPYMTAAERKNVKTPVMLLKVDDESSDAATIDISGTYTGYFDRKINLGKKLQASVLDTTGKIAGFPIYWEDKGYSGITVEDNGDTTFSVEGYYYVRAYTYSRSNKKIYSDWVKIHATEKEELTSIKMNAPEIDSDDLVINKAHPSRTINLSGCVEYCDQYGCRYDAYYDDEREEKDKWVTRDVPDIEFKVDNTAGASISDAGIMTVSRPGTYKISARAYESGANGERKYLDYDINDITIYTTCESWIGSIRLAQPAMSARDLQLQNIDDVVAVRSMKDLIVYYDQDNELWTGRNRPEVRFKVDAGSKYAEMKEDNLFIYRPGVYKVTATCPTEDSCEINPIIIEVTENEKLVINTYDPDYLRITEKDPEPAVDLTRYVEYTTQFGNKWKGTAPEVEFSLDKDTAGAALETRANTDDETGEILSEYTALVATQPGTYHVHVKVQKASQYPEEIDDIIVKARPFQSVYSVSIDMTKGKYEDDDPYIDRYTGVDKAEFNLKRRLVYHDAEGKVISGGYIDVPALEFGFFEDESEGISKPSADEAVIENGVITAYKPGEYWAYVASPSADVTGDRVCITVADRSQIHDFGDWEDATDPSVPLCLQDRVKVRRCKGHDTDGNGTIDETCDAKITDRQPPLPHELTKTDRKEPTCGEAGTDAYWTCGTCGRLFADEDAKQEIAKPEVIPATGDHSWAYVYSGERFDKDEGGSYTENVNGVYARYDTRCMKCSAVRTTEYVYIHDFDDWDYLPAADPDKPACEQDTVRVRHCKGHDLDGDGLIDEECSAELRDTVPASGHYWSAHYDEILDDMPSIYAYKQKCIKCGLVKDERVYGWSGNSTGYTDAGCTESGHQHVSYIDPITHYFTVKDKWDIAALGHVGSKYSVISEPTADKRGTEALICERCGEVIEGTEKEIPSLSEDPVEFYINN